MRSPIYSTHWLSSGLSTRNVPNFSTPNKIYLTRVYGTRFLVRLRFFVRANRRGFLSSFLYFLLTMSKCRFASRSLRAVFQAGVRARGRSVLTFEVARKGVYRRFVSRDLLVYEGSVGGYDRLSNFLVLDCRGYFYYYFCSLYRAFQKAYLV